jgi:hypothetical protein
MIYSHQYINNTTCINRCNKKIDRTTMKKWLTLQSQSHILLYVTNKDLLIDCVFFHIGKKKGVVSNQITVSIIVDFLHVKATFCRHRKSVDIL